MWKQGKAYHVHGIDADGQHLNHMLPTRARARDCKAVLKAFGGRQVTIHRLTAEGRKKVY